MKILFLPKYSQDAASSRYRTFQYLSRFTNSIEYAVSSFYGEGYVKSIGSKWKKCIFFLKGLFYRIYVVLFRSYKYDLLVIEKELIPYFLPVFEWFLLKIGQKYVLDYDDAIYCYYQNSKFFFPRILLGNKIPTISKWASGIITGSPELTLYMKKWNKHVIEIPTSINLEKYPLSNKKNDDIYFIIGWIGSYSTSKHIDSISKELIEYLHSNPMVKLHLIGYMGKAYVGIENVLIIQWNAETELNEMLKFDVGLMPLVNTPFEHGKCGFKLIQYMACAKPTIAAPFAANVKIDGGNGNLFAFADKEWSECLDKVRKDNGTYQRVGERNRKRIEDYYSIQANYKRYLNFYYNI